MNAVISQSLSAYTSAFEAAFPLTNESARSMKVPRSLVSTINDEAPMEALPLTVVVVKQNDSDNTEKVTLSAESRGSRVSPLLEEQQPLKKALSVRWKDQSNSDHTSITNPVEQDSVRFEDDEHICKSIQESLKAKKRSPSPPNLNVKEYEHRMKKLKVSIGDACKIELKLLNKATTIREKRMRMVEQLKHMRRKVQCAKVLNAQWDNNASSSSEMEVVDSVKISNDTSSETDNEDDDFVLPPVYSEKSVSLRKQSSSNYIDMTQ